MEKKYTVHSYLLIVVAMASFCAKGQGLVKPKPFSYQGEFTKQKLRAIVHAAIEKLPDNSPGSEHFMTGFYRKLSTENDLYTGLVEAAIVVQDAAYQTEIAEGSTRVRLLQFRQADETGLIDSAVIKIARKHSKGNYKPVSRNGIYRTLQYNLVRSYNKPYTLFNVDGKFAEGSIFTLEQLIVEGNDTIYHLSFEELLALKGGGYIKIKASNLAILEFERSVYMHDALMDRTFVKYREVEGRYYPEFIKVEVPRIINRNYGEHQMDIHMLWIDTIEKGKTAKLPENMPLHWMQEIHTIRLPYDPAFWTNYSLLKKYPLDTGIKLSLEREKSLESQFRGNASITMTTPK